MVGSRHQTSYFHLKEQKEDHQEQLPLGGGVTFQLKQRVQQRYRDNDAKQRVIMEEEE